jgi:hypothetical protein
MDRLRPHRPGGRPRCRQRGMVVAAVMLILILTVVFALTQMLNVSGSNVVDGQRQADSTAAFFLAESGLERGQAAYFTALVNGGTVTNAACTGIASTFNLGRGSVATTGVSNPPTCSGLACLDCTVTSTGTVGFARRTVTRGVDLNTQQGTFCNGPVTHNCSNSPSVTWKLNLANASGYDGVGMFNLAYVGKGNNVATCAIASNCRLQFDFGSPSNGQNSAGIMGNSVNIPAGQSYPIYQVMDNGDRSLVEVGVIFKGVAGAPTLTGRPVVGGASYWHTNSSGNGTIGSSVMTGKTNDGTWTNPATDTCTTATSANSQGCTNWCWGGDTLVFSYAAKVPDVNARLSLVTFGYGDTQSIDMTAVAKYPVTTANGQASDIESEIWYARNPNLLDPALSPPQAAVSPFALNASSYKGRGTGLMGARWTSGNSDSVDTRIVGSVFTVGSAYSPAAGQVIRTGDTISYSGGGGSPTCTANSLCGTITSQVTPLTAGEASGGRGRYNLSGAIAVGSANGRVWTVSSNSLVVSTCTICNIAVNDPVSGAGTGRTITSIAGTTGGTGTYTTAASPAATAYLAPGSAIRIGTPGSTVYLPAASNEPALTSPPMRIAVRSGGGVLAANTSVSSVVSAINASTKSFSLSTAPTTPIDDDTLCAGTCALFVPNGQTDFRIQQLSTVNEWAGAFTCLRGADLPAEPVTRSSGTIKRWTEVVY